MTSVRAPGSHTVPCAASGWIDYRPAIKQECVTMGPTSLMSTSNPPVVTRSATCLSTIRAQTSASPSSTSGATLESRSLSWKSFEELEHDVQPMRWDEVSDS